VKRAARVLAAILIAVATVGAQRTTTPDPILLLISFDGWRWDYIDRVPASNLKALAARGVRAAELIPSFPTFTFPNHYTIVTGLYPDHHGIVQNTIDDLAYAERFTMSAATARESRWWGGEPIWVTAERQGRRSAPLSWPGTEAPVGGVRPTAWLPFDDKASNTDRVRQVLDLLALPPERRPSFLTTYFSEVDHAGHENGPDSPELITAASHLDEALGQIVDGVRRLGLDDRTTVVVVSDHGMTPTPADRFIFLDDYVDPDSIDFVEMGAFLQLRPYPELLDVVYRQLRGRHPHLSIYKREEVPARFHYGGNPRITPIIGVLDNQRARQVTEQLLRAIRANRAKVVVIDITGVPTIDSTVANHLVQTVDASGLMGASVIITGLSSEIALTLVTIGLDLSKMNAVGDLQGGIEEAERLLGYEVTRTGDTGG